MGTLLITASQDLARGENAPHGGRIEKKGSRVRPTSFYANSTDGVCRIYSGANCADGVCTIIRMGACPDAVWTISFPVLPSALATLRPAADRGQARSQAYREEICQTASGKSSPLQIPQMSSAESSLRSFPLPWSHYVRLLTVHKPEARKFYEEEALRGGWTVKQLDRQIGWLFYERTLMSRNKVAMLKRGSRPKPDDAVSPQEEIKDPFVPEFLNLRDEYSESDLEEALLRQLEQFLLELGHDFAFIGRRRRLRIGDEWYRLDLLLFHRRLRCLVVIDLKIGQFTHADAGQMHLYLNYAREHWTGPGENPPVGLILCTHRDEAVAHYALDGLPNQVLAAEYRLALPDEKLLADELRRERRALEHRRFTGGAEP